VNVKLSCCGESNPGPALVRLDIRDGGIESGTEPDAQVDALEATPSPSEIPSLTGRLKGVLQALLIALALVTMRRAPAANG
jgi:hypothetical protein